MLGNITSLLRTFDGGKLADRADKLEEIMYELSDLDWADKLADEFGECLFFRFALKSGISAWKIESSG